MKVFEKPIVKVLTRLREAKEGQGYVEYIFIIGLVALAAVLGLTALGVNINGAFSTLSGQV